MRLLAIIAIRAIYVVLMHLPIRTCALRRHTRTSHTKVSGGIALNAQGVLRHSIGLASSRLSSLRLAAYLFVRRATRVRATRAQLFPRAAV